MGCYNVFMTLSSGMIKRITNVNVANAAHSSGFAQVQNGNSIGAASAQSFSERREIDANRTMVQKYKQSQVAQSVNRMPKAMSEEDKQAVEAAIRAKEAAMNKEKLREESSHTGSSGLRQYGAPNKNAISGSAEVTKTRGFGRMSAAEMRQNRQAAAQYRQAQADRFSGGVKTYQGGPKTFTGGTGIRPRSGY